MQMSARTTTSPEYHDGRSFRGITVTKHVGAAAAKQRVVVIAPTHSSRIDFGAHNNNLANLIRGLNERVHNVQGEDGLVPTPQPIEGAWKKLSHVATRLSERVLSKTRCPTRLTSAEFIAQCPSTKRSLYTAAAEYYMRRGWEERDAWIKVFVKFEKLNFTKKRNPAPRVIQPRSPVYNLCVGRFTRRVEADLYRALAEEWSDDVGDYVVMKGLTVEEVAMGLRKKWNRFTNPVAVGLDASRFDQHVSVDALKWEHSVYRQIFKKNKQLAKLLKCQLNNKGMAYLDGHKVKYSANGTRASGDMNTSLGNCLIMCTLVREYIRELGIHIEFANNGDDCLLFMEKEDLHKLDGLRDWFLDYGFEMEVEAPEYVFERCVFCQAQPVLVNKAEDKWVMVRQPESAFAKDSLSLSEPTERGYKLWCYQVGVGGHSLYGDMPIFGAIYNSYKRQGTDRARVYRKHGVSKYRQARIANSRIISDSGFFRMCATPRVRGTNIVPISDDTRVSFYKAFGYPPSMQIAMEKELETMEFEGLVTHLGDAPNVALSWGLTTIDVHLGG